jgi:ABC-type multidrug transport system ATPase subunit
MRQEGQTLSRQSQGNSDRPTEHVEGRIALEARAIRMDYGRYRVLRELSLRLVEGETIELRGGNGCGKSTLLRCLAGAVRPTAGEVLWFSQPSSGSAARRQWIGSVGHESRLYAHLTLRENLLLVARLCGVASPQVRVDCLLAEMGLAERGRLTPPQVSRGMRQRVTIARALIHRPRILLLDEPFSGLDGAGRAWLLERLARARRDRQTVCVATHDSDASLAGCDRRFTLCDGVLAGSTAAHGVTACGHEMMRDAA